MFTRTVIIAVLLGFLCLGGATAQDTKRVPVFKVEMPLAPTDSVASEFLTREEVIVWDYWLGREIYRSAEKDAIWRDAALQAAVDETTSRLLQSALFPIDFVSVQIRTCPQIIAYSAVGGAVTICLPMLLNAETEDELAFIIGHEIAHAMMRRPSETEFLRPEFSKMNRAEQERWADLFAIDLIVHANYSPDGAQLILDKIARIPTNCCDKHYLPSEDRRREIQDYIDELYVDQSDSTALSPISGEFEKAIDFANSYLARIEIAYRGLLGFRSAMLLTYQDAKSANLRWSVEGKSAATYNHENCHAMMDEIERIHEDLGGSDLLVQMTFSLVPVCSVMTGLRERISIYWQSNIDVSGAEFNQLAAMMVSLIPYQFGYQDEIVREMKSRVSADEALRRFDAIITLDSKSRDSELPAAMSAYRQEALHVQNVLYEICEVAGTMEHPELASMLVYAKQEAVRAKLGAGEKLVSSICDEDYKKFATLRRETEDKLNISASPLEIGYNANVSRWNHIIWYIGDTAALAQNYAKIRTEMLETAPSSN